MKAPVRALGFGLAGLAQAASIAAPWSGQPLWWLQLLSLAALVWQLDALRDRAAPRPSWRSAALYGWVFSTAWLCGTFWWLFVSMHTYGGLAVPLAAMAVLALSAALSLYYAAAAAFYFAFAPVHRAGAVILFAAAWTLAELLRNSLFTGFPWGAGGYAHVDGPLAAYAPLLGAYGLGAVAAAIAALAATALRAPRAGTRMRELGAAVILLAAPALFVAARGTPDEAALSRGRIDVALLQGNIPQDEKFIPSGGIATALQWYGEQLQRATAPLVITPETALPLLPSQLPPGYLDAIAARYASGSQTAIVGLPLGNGHVYTNTVLGFGPGRSTPYRYDKHHLVPFGEFVPRLFRWFTDMMNIPLGDFHSGGLAQPPLEWLGQRIAPNICYEDLFGDEIGANFRDEARAPTILLNVSNIAWFGDTVAIDQHLAISRMRALEFERPMVRATNTGATAVIDHRGRVTRALPRLTRGVLVAPVEGRAGLTPFAWWVSRFGLWPIWGLAIVIVAAAPFIRRRPASRAASPD
ncbi:MULTISPECIES: apolipoprotein N-acyltransferase [unclassified Variovorax]|uniref:apolipoprotein N-acyltransferase n=1 Tax=unclassified Variovorax TaxID=663243 RepID=UPI0009FC3F0C|nr:MULTISPECIES: apolipoprotein N-acyltransferase [unclassified Variovorax]PNG53402.1 Apolipoprotein N-acyltransferase [Variovorax sp. B2]PNG53975.1 Apolipoprotein N-acyltransferase [Variovorax sp. B4]VTV11444.1 Apolipoprotein N-acyltransferase [Variovorax sp. WDL1]